MGNRESHSGTHAPSLYPFSERRLDLGSLRIDEAFVSFYNNGSANDVRAYTLTDQCYRCDPEPLAELEAGELSEPMAIPSKFDTRLFVSRSPHRVLSACGKDFRIGEFGVYDCVVSESESGAACVCYADREPADQFYAILWCGLFCLALVPIWLLILFLYRKLAPRREEGAPDAQVEVPKTRVKAIDTFRGIAIATMIFVNYGGGQYWFFNHAPWNGLTVADVVFPWFMWLMGVCIPISLRAQLKRGAGKATVLRRIVKRSVILFLLGLFLQGGTDLRYLRIMGVLQRFGITYAVVAGAHLALLRRGDRFEKLPMLRDVLNVWVEWAGALALVFVNLAIVFWLDVPGCPKGYLGPGGRHDGGRYENCTGGATGYADRVAFGDHAYKSPTCQEVYDTDTAFDPEGLLGALTACFTVFLGLQAGMTIVSFPSWKERVARWGLWCLATGTVGTILCKASKEEGWIPVNKNLWSLSFVLVTACLAYFALAACYVLIDVVRCWNGSPFFFAGMNSIVLYVGHELTVNVFPWTWYNGGAATRVATHGYQLAVDLWGTALWIVVAFWLHSIGFFVAI